MHQTEMAKYITSFMFGANDTISPANKATPAQSSSGNSERVSHHESHEECNPIMYDELQAMFDGMKNLQVQKPHDSLVECVEESKTELNKALNEYIDCILKRAEVFENPEDAELYAELELFHDTVPLHKCLLKNRYGKMLTKYELKEGMKHVFKCFTNYTSPRYTAHVHTFCMFWLFADKETWMATMRGINLSDDAHRIAYSNALKYSKMLPTLSRGGNTVLENLSPKKYLNASADDIKCAVGYLCRIAMICHLAGLLILQSRKTSRAA